MRSAFVICSVLLGFAALGHAKPPGAPAGFRWTLNDSLSDEFEGTELDASKWHDHVPRWEGRAPGKFMPSAISVKDGLLQISCSPMKKPEGKFTIACGAVQAKAKDAKYGYYECRMKASQLSTSTNFWLVSDPIDLPIGKLGLELIIQFGIGNSKEFSNHMKSNALFALKPPEKGAKRIKAKKTDRVELRSGVADEFHTYGCWWVDANTLKFYADGEYVYTINPSTKFDERPFRHPLLLTLICETFDWLPLPSEEELNDPLKNTALFDYVRTYELEKGE